jgi:hypothetical protein
MCSTAEIVRVGVGVELAGFALALFGIYQNWKFISGAAAIEIATAKAQAVSNLLARALHSVERAIRPPEPETKAQAGTGRVTATAYNASGSSTTTLTAEAAGTVTIQDRLDRLEWQVQNRLEWQVQNLTGNVERLELEREALDEALAGLRDELDAERAEREGGDREADSRLNRFVRSGLLAGIAGVVFFSLGTVATGLPAGAEHLLCG